MYSIIAGLDGFIRLSWSRTLALRNKWITKVVIVEDHYGKVSWQRSAYVSFFAIWISQVLHTNAWNIKALWISVEGCTCMRSHCVCRSSWWFNWDCIWVLFLYCIPFASLIFCGYINHGYDFSSVSITRSCFCINNNNLIMIFVNLYLD